MPRHREKSQCRKGRRCMERKWLSKGDILPEGRRGRNTLGHGKEVNEQGYSPFGDRRRDTSVSGKKVTE